MSNMFDVQSVGSLAEPSALKHYTRQAAPKQSLFSVQLLREAALSLAELRRVSNSFQARDLLALLRCHAVRRQRAMMPKVKIQMRTSVSDGHQAVRIVLR